MSADFIEAFVHAIQIWNLDLDKEPSYSDDIEQKSVNRFIYSDILD